MMSQNKVPQIRFEGFCGEWEKKEFSKTFTNISNNTLSRAELNYNSGLARNVHYGDVLIKFGELLDVEKEEIPFIINNDFVSKFKSSKLQDGDIIIADAAEDEMVGKCTEVVNIKEEIIFAGLHTIAVRPAFSFASKYLGYYMNSPLYHNQLLPLLQGTKVLSISKSAIKNTMIYSPADSLEQTRIGNYFQQLDKLIEEKEKKHQKLKQFKKAMLDKMFPKNEANTPEVRFEGFSGEWEEKKLEEFSNLTHGDGDWILSKDITNDGEYKIVQLGNISLGKYIEKKLKTVSLDTFETLKGTPIKKGDLLINRMVDGNVNCCIFEFDGNYITSVDVCWIRENEYFNNYFLMNLLIIKESQKSLLSLSSGSGRIRISKMNFFKKFIFLLPEIKEQEKIGNYFQTLDIQIDLQNKEIEKLKNIKKASLDKMFV